MNSRFETTVLERPLLLKVHCVVLKRKFKLRTVIWRYWHKLRHVCSIEFHEIINKRSSEENKVPGALKGNYLEGKQSELCWPLRTVYYKIIKSVKNKGALCSSGEEIYIKSERSLLTVFTAKQTKSTNTCCFHDWIDLKGEHDLILFYFVYTWRTLPPF